MTESERLHKRLIAATVAMPAHGPPPVRNFLNGLTRRGRLLSPLQRVQAARDALRLSARMVQEVVRSHPRTAGGIRRQACKLELAGDVARYGTALLAECGYRGDLAREIVVMHAHGLPSKKALRPLSPPCPYDLTDEELKAASDRRRAEREFRGDRTLDEDFPPWPDSLDESEEGST